MKSISKILVLATYAISAYAVQAAPVNKIVGNWHLDETRGQKAFDSSGYNKHGQLGASKAADSFDPVRVARRFDNAALSFSDGQFVKVPHANNLQPQKISVEAWVKPGTAPASSLPYILAKGQQNCSFASYALYIYNKDSDEQAPNTAHFYVAYADGSAEGTYVESPVDSPDILDGNWHHLVGTYDQTAVRLYVDGVEVGTGTPHTAPIPYDMFTNKDLYIGDYDGDANSCDNYNGNYVGELDEVKVWSKALTAEEVVKRYLGD